jgi:hypothetical protein
MDDIADDAHRRNRIPIGSLESGCGCGIGRKKVKTSHAR